jgi:hypothetical protein
MHAWMDRSAVWMNGWMDGTVRYAYKHANSIPADCYATLVSVRVSALLYLAEILIQVHGYILYYCKMRYS